MRRDNYARRKSWLFFPALAISLVAILFPAVSEAAAPPKISVSPASLNFGSVNMGTTSAPKTVTIKNTGKSSLVISKIGITGTNAQDFKQTNNCSAVAGVSACTVNITFSPSLASKESAVLSISSNDPKKPTSTVILSGKGVAIPFSISLATNSALPLTPLSITTHGLIQGATVTVIFADTKGYSVQETPLSTDSAGTLLVAVPLYVDSKTHQISTGTVKVTVKQTLSSGSPGPQASASLTIQSPPSTAGTGVLPGQISHQFLTALALTVQNRMSDLAFLEISSNGAIDTSAGIQSETTILQSIIATRNNVDTIMGNPTQTISAGTAQDGTPLLFTSDSLNTMDQVIALWVSGLPLQTASSSFPHAKLSRRLPHAQLSGIMDTANSITKELSTWAGLANDTKKLQSDSSTTLDSTLAAYEGAANSLTLMGASTQAVGLFTGIAGAANAGYHYMNDWGQIVTDVAKCAGTGPCSTTVNDVDAFTQNGAGDLLSAYVHAGINNLDYLYKGALTGPASLAQQCYDLVSGNGQKSDNTDMGNGIDSLRNGGAWMNGPVQDNRTQSGLDLIVVDAQPYADAPLPITGITDSNGQYSLPIPTGPNGKMASTVVVDAYDPMTGDMDGSSQVVDLSGAGTGQSYTVPPVSISLFPDNVPVGIYLISGNYCMYGTCYPISDSISIITPTALAEEIMCDLDSYAGSVCWSTQQCNCYVNLSLTPFDGTSFTATYTETATCTDPTTGNTTTNLATQVMTITLQ